VRGYEKEKPLQVKLFTDR